MPQPLWPAALLTMKHKDYNRIVGASVSARKGRQAAGSRRYIDDIEPRHVVRDYRPQHDSPRLIRSIALIAVSTGRIHRGNAAMCRRKSYSIDLADQPCLATVRSTTATNHTAFAHPDKHKLREAWMQCVSSTILCLRLHYEESERQDQIVWARTSAEGFLLDKGNVDSVWESAAHIVEGEYRTGAQEHLTSENTEFIAEWSAGNGVTVVGSLQCPYYVHKNANQDLRFARRESSRYPD